MPATSQERLALGVVALLLAAGAGARALGHRTSTLTPALYSTDALSSGAPGGASSDLVDGMSGLDGMQGRVKRKTEQDKARSTPLAAGEKLDPNTATADELDRLPGVGHALAERIVQARKARGRFRTLADLDSVSGVGPRVLAQMAPHLTLPAAPPSSPAVTSPRSPSSSPANGGTMRGFLSTPPATRRPSSTRPPSTVPAGPVDLNTASAAELEALPGIGPSLAGKVLAWRAANGRFRSAEDLLKVGGIGPAKLARLRPLVRATP
ncbi:MAG TPA: helix-hairpin-helix domain-containing protein [Longimicrobiaceae bacterium]|jgi:competence ComEA-like helix-hairpin-helix protein|nr:helix-hairpin-helix domain-containing protein [Longimicrobiaceae bacterium]